MYLTKEEASIEGEGTGLFRSFSRQCWHSDVCRYLPRRYRRSLFFLRKFLLKSRGLLLMCRLLWQKTRQNLFFQRKLRKTSLSLYFQMESRRSPLLKRRLPLRKT